VKEPYDVAAQLTLLAAWIDGLMADETASRQAIAEEASARLKDITRAYLSAGERATPAAGEPVETEQQARELPAVQAVYEALRAGQPGAARDLKVRLLEEACRAAGVDLGPYDDRILSWLAEWGPETCAVVAGLITRAADGPASPEEAVKAAVAEMHEPHRDTLRQAFADGIAYRMALFSESATCPECAGYPQPCADHQGQRDTASVYRSLAGAIGIDPDAGSWDDQ
jgi:hypothetical protein